MACPRRQAGFSLIELMIALLIGMLLVLGVVQVFGASRAAYQLSEGLSRTQENGRFAMDFLQRDLRMVGHFGCINDQARLLKTNELNSHLNVAQLNFAQSLQGYEATSTGPTDTINLASPTSGWSPTLPTYISGLTPAPLPGSDIVELRFLTPEGIPVTAVSGATLTVDSAKWDVLTGSGVTSPVMFGVADCTYSDIFNGTASGGVVTATSGGINTSDTAAFTTAFARYTASPAGQTALYRAEALVYYVATGAGDVPALYRARFNGSTATVEELVEGIDSLQLLYGRDAGAVTALTGDTASADTADTLATTETEWRRVGQVQVGILASSPQTAAAAAASGETTTPSTLGTQYTLPSDAKFRASYEATIALRNRLYGN
ncbi:MAG: PilW family protein [Pseudoxanthomonas sp.]